MSLLSAPEPVEAVLRRSHTLLEAPRFGADGELIYSDAFAGGLFAVRDGTVRELLPGRRGVGGALAHSEGGWVLSGRGVLHLAADGSQRELLATGDGVHGFNDLGATPEGGLLAGGLRFRPFAGEQPNPGVLVELTPQGERRVLSEDVLWPNGIACAADGATVFICDYARGAVLAVDRQSGATSEFARSPRGSADGLALDAEGGVWVALGDAGAIARFDRDGRLDQTADVPASFVTSLSFGGPDMRDVLISTADNEIEPDLGGTLFLARSEIPGAAVAKVRV